MLISFCCSFLSLTCILPLSVTACSSVQGVDSPLHIVQLHETCQVLFPLIYSLTCFFPADSWCLAIWTFNADTEAFIISIFFLLLFFYLLISLSSTFTSCFNLCSFPFNFPPSLLNHARYWRNVIEWKRDYIHFQLSDFFPKPTLWPLLFASFHSLSIHMRFQPLTYISANSPPPLFPFSKPSLSGSFSLLSFLSLSLCVY